MPTLGQGLGQQLLVTAEAVPSMEGAVLHSQLAQSDTIVGQRSRAPQSRTAAQSGTTVGQTLPAPQSRRAAQSYLHLLDERIRRDLMGLLAAADLPVGFDIWHSCVDGHVA